jgi:hypothetical protein
MKFYISAPKLLVAEVSLHRLIESELKNGGWLKDEPEYERVFISALSFHRKFGKQDYDRLVRGLK